MCCHDIMYFSNFLGCDTMARIELVTIGKLIETNTSNSVVYIYIYIYLYTHTHTHTHTYIYICICLSHIKERAEVSGQPWLFFM